MLKRVIIKKATLGVIAVMCIGFLFSGCGDMKGSFFTLSELYENGSLTRDNVMNIAALRTDDVRVVVEKSETEWELEKIEFNVAEPEILSDTIAKKIEKDFKKTKDGKFTSFEMHYYGTYGDYFVVEISYSLKDVDIVAGIWPIVVSDIYLGTISAGSALVAWREKTD